MLMLYRQVNGRCLQHEGSVERCRSDEACRVRYGRFHLYLGGTAATSTNDVSSAGKRDQRGLSRRRKGSAHCCDPSVARDIQNMSPLAIDDDRRAVLRAWDPLLILPGDIGLSKRGREIGDAVRAVDRSLGARRPSIPPSVRPNSAMPITAVALMPGHPPADLRAASTRIPKEYWNHGIVLCPSIFRLQLALRWAQGKRKRRRSKIDGAIRSGWLRSVRRSSRSRPACAWPCASPRP